MLKYRIVRTIVVWLLSILILQPGFVRGVSVGSARPLSFISPVEKVSIDTRDQRIDEHSLTSVTLRIPSHRRYHNIPRRWWAVTDPLNSGVLKKWKRANSNNIQIGRTFGSEKLYSYLTRNSSTIETPDDQYQEYKFVMEPNKDLFDNQCRVWTIDESGNHVAHPDFEDCANPSGVYKGTAYRKISLYKVSDGSIKHQFKPVGWARIVVHEDGKMPKIHGSWKVDDEDGLGVPAAIYHLDELELMRAKLSEIELPLLNNVGSSHVVWRDLDMKTDQEFDDGLDQYRENDYNFILGRDYTYDVSAEEDLTELSDFDLHRKYDVGVMKRDNTGRDSNPNLYNSIGDTNGCPTHRQIALIGIAVDCNFLGLYNSTSDVRKHVIDVMNSASQVYEPLNISLGLSAIVMANSTNCPDTPASDGNSLVRWNYRCNATPNTIGDRLSYFAQWRSQDNRSDDGLATWSLLTTCNEGSIVGLSWLGQLCDSWAVSESDGNISVAGANVIAHTALDWRVVAHEIGHSFGAVHDCTSDTCAQHLDQSSQCCPLSTKQCDSNGLYIMNPSSTDSTDGFSPCSIGNICSGMRNSLNTTCLTSNTNVHLVTDNVCGNGIVEEGEDCDCGGPSGCGNDTCCDPNTCKFTAGSQCDDSNDVCCTNCRFASKDTLCRSAQSECDVPEFCTGDSVACPSNQFAKDGTACSVANNSISSNGLSCASGHCTSRDVQCATIMNNVTVNVGGASLTVDRACSDDSSCQLSCTNSTGNVCYVSNQNFLDGTACKNGGRCQSGSCVGGNNDTRVIRIVLLTVLLIVAAVVTYICIFRFWLRRRQSPRPRNSKENIIKLRKLKLSPQEPQFGEQEQRSDESRRQPIPVSMTFSPEEIDQRYPPAHVPPPPPANNNNNNNNGGPAEANCQQFPQEGFSNLYNHDIYAILPPYTPHPYQQDPPNGDTKH